MNINSVIDFKNVEANLKYDLHCEILHNYLKYKAYCKYFVNLYKNPAKKNLKISCKVSTLLY